jgi:hypothetical protein
MLNIVPLAVSGSALLLSIISYIYSVITKKYETLRTLRLQLSDVFSRIYATDLESLKVSGQAGITETLRQAEIGQLNQQRYFLLHQAMRLAEDIPKLVTDVEYNTIAYTSANVGDPLNADKFYRKANDAAPTPFFQSSAIRSYAVFLFNQHRFEEGRRQFENAASLITGSDNQARFARGTVYQNWAYSEHTLANSPKRAEQCVESARSEFSGIDVETFRNQLMAQLESQTAPFPKPAPAVAQPNAGAAAP